MKLEKYEDKSKKKRKAILISISVIVLVSVSLLLYKTFASFTESAEFPMMNGKVDYFGNSDIYFVFYQGDKELEEMPQKDNKENLVFDHGECDNGASIEWNSEAWGPVVKNLSKSKTKCSLYFKEQKEIVLGKDILPVKSGDGLYAVTHDDLEELGQEWNKIEYRYAGVDPDNYVEFNNEIWRIIGLVNVKVGSSVEQRVKIVRTDGVNKQSTFGLYAWDKNVDFTNNWTTSKLKDMLNGIYYESGTGECYIENHYSSSDNAVQSTCDFNTGYYFPKGLDETARNMIDKVVTWNIGGWDEPLMTADQFYEKERGTSTGSSNTYPSEWSIETDVGEKHNGIGLIYLSDYGYAVGGEVRNNCLTKDLFDYDKDNCNTNDWLKSNYSLWALFPASSGYQYIFGLNSLGSNNFYRSSNNDASVVPVGYLTSSTKIINGHGTIGEPYILQIEN